MSDVEQPILTSTQGRVGIITLNRPAQMNALNDALMTALGEALLAFEKALAQDPEDPRGRYFLAAKKDLDRLQAVARDL